MAAHRRRRLHALRLAAAWSVTGAVALVVGAAVLVPRAAGATPYVVLTGSMEPAMPPGTLVVTRPAAADAIGVGSVITYQLASGEPTVATHRVVAVGVDTTGERVFRTQGDANGAPDPGWVRPVQVRGERWYSVPYLGHVTTLVSEADRQLVSTLVAAGLLGYAGVTALGAVRDRRPAVHA